MIGKKRKLCCLMQICMGLSAKAQTEKLKNVYDKRKMLSLRICFRRHTAEASESLNKID